MTIMPFLSSSLIVLFLLAIVSPMAKGGETKSLTTATEAHRFAETISQESASFCLTGTVICVLTSTDLVIEDESGIVRLRLPQANRIRRGSILAVRGHSEIDYSRAKTLHVDDFSVLGQHRPPEPVDIRIDRPVDAALDYRIIRTEGLVVNVTRDSINPAFIQLTLQSGDSFAVAAWEVDPASAPDLGSYFGKYVRITGAYERHRGGRRFFAGPIIMLPGPEAVETLDHRAANVFDVPELPFTRLADPSQIARLGRHRISGTVLASWRRNCFLLMTDDARFLRVTLAGNAAAPTCGAHVLVAGYPDTDLLQVNLVNAFWRADNARPLSSEPPETTSVAALVKNGQGFPRIDVARHGHALRIRGKLRDIQPIEGRLIVQDGDDTLPVDVSSNPDVLAHLAPGCEVEVTGVAIVETDSWRPNVILPDIRGIFLVIRTPADIRVLSHPPWWTINRLLLVICALIVGLLGIFAWNRVLNRIIIRRSRDLAREQVATRLAKMKVEERTRLAVELHDTLSQNLEGLACQVSATESVLPTDPPLAATLLAAAGRMLDSCRSELRRCLFDLRSDALDARDFNAAIRTTLAPIIAETDVRVRFDVRRAAFTESETHAILAIVRELVSNAIRHGQAKNILVAGEFHDGQLSFSVRDDGCGFEPGTQPGPSSGHFGLQGIRERVRTFGGTLILESKSGGPTRAEVRLPVSQRQSE